MQAQNVGARCCHIGQAPNMGYVRGGSRDSSLTLHFLSDLPQYGVREVTIHPCSCDLDTEPCGQRQASIESMADPISESETPRPDRCGPNQDPRISRS